ncbi:hypothetical protein [Dictyobacter arantiisoli]|nr:hypothetical protein [Dictyobacter arantiisoli]
MYNTLKKHTCLAVAIVLVLLLIASSLKGSMQAQAASSKMQTGKVDPTIDQVAQEVLWNIRTNGFNPIAKTKGMVTGGLYVNWRMDNPGITNNVNPNSNDDPPSSHDIQTDLFYLNALAEYKYLHGQESSHDQDIARITPIVHNEFFNYNLPKGWVYFYLLRDGYLLNDPVLTQEAQMAATNYYNNWYDQRLGLLYNKSHTPGVYSVEHSLTAGAALIDAGTRMGHPEWVQAGKATINTVLPASYNIQAQLFYNNMTVNADGSEMVMNEQGKASTQGSAVEALLAAYEITHNPQYLTISTAVLQSLFTTSGLWDQRNGGLFFAYDLNSRTLEQKYKETRAQAHILIGLYRYNQIMRQLGQSQQFLDKQQQLINLLSTNFYQPIYHGYFYRVTPTFGNVISNGPDGTPQPEIYFTTEAMGLALDALQQTEFSTISL